MRVEGALQGRLVDDQPARAGTNAKRGLNMLNLSPLCVHRSLLTGLVMVGVCMSAVAQADDNSDQAAPRVSTAKSSFMSENNASMSKMITGMDAASSGDIDRDFVMAMTAHHQGAIDMAVTMLRYGHNEQLKRIAQEIIVDQQQEIAAMHQAMGDPLPPSIASPTQAGAIRP